ncbi:hypothetical protein MTO96_046153, partial [Rhipicephalus appendiculatus]
GRIDVDLYMTTGGYAIIVWSLRSVQGMPKEEVWNQVVVDVGRYAAEISITFFYTVQGPSAAQLSLSVRTSKDGPWKRVWFVVHPTQFLNFIPQHVELHESEPYQVAFIGEYRKTGLRGYIAVDDVTFSTTCSRYQG